MNDIIKTYQKEKEYNIEVDRAHPGRRIAKETVRTIAKNAVDYSIRRYTPNGKGEYISPAVSKLISKIGKEDNGKVVTEVLDTALRTISNQKLKKRKKWSIDMDNTLQHYGVKSMEWGKRMRRYVSTLAEQVKHPIQTAKANMESVKKQYKKLSKKDKIKAIKTKLRRNMLHTIADEIKDINAIVKRNVRVRKIKDRKKNIARKKNR